ncbi:MAG TPA: tRNA (adenosine(37)-N6)-threonylcarbamoyltransferase complex ATPase subunit type 1 TsaE [Bradyrhizobium sp.]|uniref:tRNA (adenosine(37)-N6)-threonylcarbamoyltransferase complex ATPase subunit type 1 TsaE n=1 Tax=Bradyrhizobium sp. TaxID=376 RepID=UPI002B80B70C|nr:tRNA (adenosine(37)-N6)-threonylcarbamoyltransferase complex ATPase subunit type 1 TsaE [Bradyrhizobium sp.]HLZ04386.1 tRNA (adenosine(37)-N6)-threonylcarbamoyltransferase complex ATPase subunit type 1 TsaE [Bradyrhizobium sp.]
MNAPETPSTTLSVALANETATAHLMADLALLVGPGDVITLSGDLGAGKTAAARAMIRYLADDDTLEVPSPTFTLTQSYELAAFPLLHADLYRISDASELEEIGLSPLPEGVVALIEWPERAGGTLPPDRIDIAFSHRPALGSNARAAEITGFGKAAALVERLKHLRDFLHAAGFIDAKRKRMAGDASIRSYARLILDDQAVILMNSPKRPDGPAIYDGKSYSAAVHLAEDVKPFVAIDQALRERGFSAPEIHHRDLEGGFLITEDFGSAPVVEGDPPAPIDERYEAATDVLAALHRDALPEILPLAPPATYSIPVFDIDAWLVEIGLMLEWYLPDRGAPPSGTLRSEFVAVWRDILQKPATAERTWVIRDFHSPNLIWLAERDGIKRIGIIDFQDMVLGPAAYDLVSLLQDARIDVPELVELALFSRYIKARRAADANFDAAEFATLYAIMSAQRNTRLLGTFARLNRRDGKPQYLKHQPRIWTYLNRSLAHPALEPLRAWYAANVPPPAQ